MLSLALALASFASPVITIDVDASDIARRIVHAKMVIPSKPGPATLVYAKWIPGEHGPTGPIDGVVNLRFTAISADRSAAVGKPLAWRRDPVEMYAFHVDVPAGATAIEAALDFVTPTEGGAFSAGPMASENIAVISWNHFTLTPKGMKSDDVMVQARLTIPKGWEAGTAMRPSKRTGNTMEFAPVTYTTLVDSPVNMGRYFKKVPIGDGHVVNIAADSAAALAVPEDTVTEWKQLVTETGALFGGRPYAHYDFLLTLSDHVESFGLEHHESSDNRVEERTLIDDDKRAYNATLLAHEFAHAWNGKYRRPAGLATGDYETPMDDELLWVYEGLTQYLGTVLAARSGLETQAEWLGEQAFWAATLDHRGGRAWRPLQDTAASAQTLYGAARQWSDARRGVDFYDEGLLLWLEVDVRIRALTGGKKSFDDFARAFHGTGTGKAELKPYTFDDVVTALNATAPYDWRGFWRQHLDQTSTHPLDGLNAAGWTLSWVDERPPYVKTVNTVDEVIDERFSIGLVIKSEDHTIIDVMPGSPAWTAGVSPGMKILGVNGRKWDDDAVDDALRETKDTPLELLVENADFYKVIKLNYRGGARYPVLVRDAKRPDVLSQILTPRTPHQPRTPKKP